jgi:drug/metabolite transporter (DMT)-like permease
MAATAIAVPQLCIVAAEDSISPGLTAVTGTLVPLLTYVVSSFVLRTTPWRLSGVAGVLIAIAGMIVFVDARTLIDNSSELFGVAIMACGSLVFVANGLYAAHQSDDLDQYVLTVWVVIFAAVGLSIAAMAIEGLPPAMPGDAELLAVAASGTVGIGLAYLFYYLLIARAGASFTALYAFLVPPFGVLFTVLFDDGTLSLRHVVGLAIVLCGLWFVMRPGTAAT